MRPAIFALRVPKAAVKKAVTASQLVAAFLNTTLANLGGGIKVHCRLARDMDEEGPLIPR